MRIDNSGFVAFWKCPLFYRYSGPLGLKLDTKYFDFGRRFHRLLEEFYSPVKLEPSLPLEDPQTENEVQVMFEAYKAFYPSEDFEVVECERKFELPLYMPLGRRLSPGGLDSREVTAFGSTPHTYLGKIDMLIRQGGRLCVFETKTESRSSKDNTPPAWAARTQASLYTWAASQIFGEPIDRIILNICTKVSPKGQVGPSFRRDILERTPAQVEQALKDLIWVADRLEEMESSGVYPRNTNSCVNKFGYPCDFYTPCHTGGMTPELLSTYKQEEQFAHLEI